MTVVTYTYARQHLAKVMDQAVKDRAPITVTRQGSDPVVVIAAGEFAAMEETLHLLSSPRNAKRLLDSIADAERGHTTPRKLIGTT
ncbi:MAG: type II toxin-antitoxin system prevent-host-death family antitoxin [Rhodospirillaceae bacterium]|nr:type II toxin-antitoxin system prevent-host-death family antitoxin [Rhodospirillaceae bacterium]